MRNIQKATQPIYQCDF